MVQNGDRMSIDAVKQVSRTAERMRLYRKRRQEGLQVVRIPLHVTELLSRPRGTVALHARPWPEMA
jgi:hypothetical protein